MSTSFCSLSRRLSISVRHTTRPRLLPCNNSTINPNIVNKRAISYLPWLHTNNTTHSINANPYQFRTFSSDPNGKNNNNNNDIPNTCTNNSRIYNEAKNQKSLVRATGKNKSLVPYIGSVLIIPVQKPLFPGFSSMLYLKDENLKIHFIQQFRKRIQAQYNKDNNIENAKDIINSTEWIGLFLANPKTTPITAEDELKNDNNKSDSNNISTENNNNIGIEHMNTNETHEQVNLNEDKIVWHPALDEVNSDMHHFVETLPQSADDIFEYGVLAKIDYSDETTNIAEFVKLENHALALSTMSLSNEQKENMNKNRHEKTRGNKSKSIPFPVSRWEDPLVLKVISARRIKLDSIAEHQPLLTGNIQHLQPHIHIKKSDISKNNNNNETENININSNELDIADMEVINENKHIVNESESEIKCRSAFNVASDLLRRLYADDPDNRRDMIQLWSARHHIDIGFFCDFAASITNSTPRELQKLLQCVDYGERLELLCRMLKREECMMKKRDEIMNNVDALIKKEDESHYLRMILHTTQRRLMINHREKNILSYGAGTSGHGHHHRHVQSHPNPIVEGATDHNNGNNMGQEEEKKDRYQRLAHKFKERVEGKIMCAEAKEVFDEGIEKLLNAKNKESLDVETTKQYLDWISCLPWNCYSVDNDNINHARDILDHDHFGMKLVKDRILEVIACNILRGELNLNEVNKQYDHDIDGQDNDNNMQNENENVSKILCLVGPPGVGKTSIGSSIARALHRKFFKFSLGGSDDSHLLKGFLRTYAGSQPGKIIYGLKQCQTSNPMILIDEIDKMGARHSDPSHALLEILDPSQNQAFSDNYLDFSVDLSKILFVCTANDESKINPILKDRLQIIHLNGYDEFEKLQIAKKYLIPNALKKCGLKNENISLSDEVIIELIKWYSRESGVRSLAQNIEKICYKSALQLAEAGITYKDIHKEQKEIKIQPEDNEINNHNNEHEHHENNHRTTKILEKFSSFVKRIASDSDVKENNKTEHDNINDEEQEVLNNEMEHEIPFISINKENLKTYVGLRKYQNERTYLDEKTVPYGVVTGLAYTTNGGCITYVETIKYNKKSTSDMDGNGGGNGNGGNIKATGQLGKVMNESVEIAQCVARSVLLNKMDGNNTFFNDYNVHLHCPEGGIAKDGPSAGITMVTALLSLALNEKISPNIAMTGEITLTGKILKIGGLKEKLLAAKRSKINTLILPFDNFDDFYDDEFGIPKYLRDEFKDVHFVKSYDEVLQILFHKHLLPTQNMNENNFENNNQFHAMDDLNLNKSPEMPKPL